MQFCPLQISISYIQVQMVMKPELISLESLVKLVFTTEEVISMAKIRKRKIRWNPSSTADVVGYKVYWSVGGGVNYNSESAEVGMRTEVILPDELPSFPLVEGEIELSTKWDCQ